MGKKSVVILEFRKVKARAGKAEGTAPPKRGFAGQAQRRKKDLLDHGNYGSKLRSGFPGRKRSETDAIFSCRPESEQAPFNFRSR